MPADSKHNLRNQMLYFRLNKQEMGIEIRASPLQWIALWDGIATVLGTLSITDLKNSSQVNGSASSVKQDC